jgi:hypothetical protein
MVVLAATIVLIPGAPLGLITTGVQALAGVLLPSATIFLLLLCNDKAVLGPWVNRPWLNAVAIVIVSILLMMSFVLMATTLFTKIDVNTLAVALGAALVFAYLVAGGLYLSGLYLISRKGRVSRKGRAGDTRAPSKEFRANWRMPPLNLLERPKWSKGRLVAMYSLRVYLVVAVVLLLVKAIQLGVHK